MERIRFVRTGKQPPGLTEEIKDWISRSLAELLDIVGVPAHVPFEVLFGATSSNPGVYVGVGTRETESPIYAYDFTWDGYSFRLIVPACIARMKLQFFGALLIGVAQLDREPDKRITNILPISEFPPAPLEVVEEEPEES